MTGFQHFLRSLKIMIVVLFVLIVLVLIFRTAFVEGSSMSPTLSDGDVNIMISTASLPDDGDIIVFQSDRIREEIGLEKLGRPLVKRVIARDGEYVSVLNNGNTVYVSDCELSFDEAGAFTKDANGNRVDIAPLTEDYITAATRFTYAEVKNYKVPEDCVYVLGDNRGDSTDSRCFGAVELDEILGRIAIRVYPFSSFGKVS